MKFILALACFFSFSSSAQADPRISHGNWILGGSTSFSFASRGSSYFSLSPEAQYFLVDNVAAGLAGSLATSKGNTSYFISPIATFHMSITEAKTVVPYLSIKPLEYSNFSGGSGYYSSAARIGVKFFLTDSVAIGPAFEDRHYWPKNGGLSTDVGTLYGVFSIHI